MLKVSVAMITYNQESYIKQAIQSALMQTPDFPFEIIVGEDCSTDSTREIVLDMQRQNPKVIRALLAETNPRDYGKSNFVNTLFACQGEYIALLEGDDYWTDPDKLQIQADFLDRHPKCSFCFHPANVIIEGEDTPTSVFPSETKSFYSLWDLLKGNFIQTCTVMFRRSHLRPFPNWFYELIMSDYPLHILNAMQGRIGCIDQIMSTYRIHKDGIWSMQPLTPRLQETILFYRFIEPDLSYVQRVRLRSTMSSVLTEASSALWDEGQEVEAKKHLCEAFRLHPARMVFSRKFRRGIIRRYFK